jgi:EAL domain-containing protein (putative c-di-GMP-specific phosphodiesterase class I)
MTIEDKDVELKGAFVESLKRRSGKIKDDRATAIAEDVELIYKRTVEDLQTAIKRLKREQENAMDVSPDTALSLRPANDFNTAMFVTRDLERSVEIRKLEIKLELAEQRYKYLFGAV